MSRYVHITYEIHHIALTNSVMQSLGKKIPQDSTLLPQLHEKNIKKNHVYEN